MVADDRGQVLLLGGLAIAIVFLTAIPLSNSLVVSESASTSETVNDIDRAAEREANVERGLRVLANRSTDRSPSALNQTLDSFTNYYGDVSAQQDGVYVDAELNIAETEGNITEQTSPGGFQQPDPGGGPLSGNNDWYLAQNVDDIAIFDLTVTNTNGGPMNAFRIVVTDGSNTNELRAVRNGSLTDIRDSTGTTICWGSSVDLDLIRGTCDGTTSGTFTPITDGLDAPYSVSYRNGNRADGTYTFASTGRFPDSSYDPSPPNPDYRPYGIRPAFDISYTGPETSYQRTILVNTTA